MMDAVPAVPAQPAVDGAKRLQELERRGIVRPITAADRKNPPPIVS
jgi:hypothetical protein